MPPKRVTQKTNTKKRPASSDSGANKARETSTLDSPGKEKPAKRPRTSTISNAAAGETGSTANVSADKGGVAETTEAAAPKAVGKASKAPPKDDVPKLTGNFDLYGMSLPFLNKVYSPSNSDTVCPEDLYRKILTYQAKNDRTAKITIPKDFASGEPGAFRSAIFSDPMEDMPFDIAITDIEEVKGPDLQLDLAYERPTDDWNGPGLEGDMQLEEEACGIESSSGEISIRPLWKKVDNDGEVMELFEGIFSFRITYSRLYSRKGHGEGQSLTLAFWAVRAKA